MNRVQTCTHNNESGLYRKLTQMRFDTATSIKGKLLERAETKISNFGKNLIKRSQRAVTEDWMVITFYSKEL